VTKSESDVGEELKLPDVNQTIAKLKGNGYQYATAGDVRRLIARIEELEQKGNT